jgi:hypothetical protein
MDKMLQWTFWLGQNVTVDVVNLDVTSRQQRQSVVLYKKYTDSGESLTNSKRWNKVWPMARGERGDPLPSYMNYYWIFVVFLWRRHISFPSMIPSCSLIGNICSQWQNGIQRCAKMTTTISAPICLKINVLTNVFVYTLFLLQYWLHVKYAFS